MLVDDRELTERAARIEALLGEIETFPDPAVRDKAAEIVQGLLLLYGEGLARILDLIEDRAGSETSAEILDGLAADELVSHLLFLHDLHPVDVERRVARALDEVRPYLESHGGDVELLGIEDGVARLRLQGSCSGCPSSTMTLKLAIEEAIQRAAPDLDGVEAEGVAEPAPRPITLLPASDAIRLKQKVREPDEPAWVQVDGADSLDGTPRGIEVAGVSLLFLQCEGALYAYHNLCPGCARSLEEGALRGAELTCPGCGRRYDVRQAGRCLDIPGAHLEPVPLLVRDDGIKVALGAS